MPDLVIELADIDEILARSGIVFAASPLDIGLGIPAINLHGLIRMAVFGGFGDINADIESIGIWSVTALLKRCMTASKLVKVSPYRALAAFMSVKRRTVGSSNLILGSGCEPFLAGRLRIKVNAKLRSLFFIAAKSR